jgi:hypothetical protein
MAEVDVGHRPLEIIYIGGYGRSGSTLLDHLVASRIGALSCGELCNVFAYAARHAACTCGENITTCSVWGACLEHVRRKTGLDYSELDSITRRAEAGNLEEADWHRVWTPLFESLAQQGFTAIVDSSKSSGGRDRVRLLERSPAARMSLFVHLDRYLPAVLNSRRRGDNRSLEEGEESGSRTRAALRGTVGWWRANLLAKRQRRRVPNACSVTYEALGHNASLLVDGIAMQSGIRCPPTSQERIYHAVAGNRMARSGWDGLVKPDEVWQTELPTRWRIWGAGHNRIAQLFGVVSPRQASQGWRFKGISAPKRTDG